VTLRCGDHPRIWSTAVREALLIGGASAVIAAVVWLARPDRLPLRAQAEIYELELAAPVVPAAEAVAFFEAGDHLFIDARENTAGGEIPGAFRVRSSTFDADLAEVHDFLYPEDKLVLYDGGVMQAADAVAVRFQERGYANVTILQGGVAAWRVAGGPLAGGDEHAP
jgi:rhodanese-related sulfurtransferase